MRRMKCLANVIAFTLLSVGAFGQLPAPAADVRIIMYAPAQLSGRSGMLMLLVESNRPMVIGLPVVLDAPDGLRLHSTGVAHRSRKATINGHRTQVQEPGRYIVNIFLKSKNDLPVGTARLDLDLPCLALTSSG